MTFVFMLILDSTAFDHCDVDAFTCWPASMVWDEMDRHQAGQYFSRFSAERAGLVEFDEVWDEVKESVEAGVANHDDVVDDGIDDPAAIDSDADECSSLSSELSWFQQYYYYEDEETSDLRYLFSV